MLKIYKFLFYILPSVLVLTVPINCRRSSRYSRQASGFPHGGPPGGPHGGPPGGPHGGPPGGPHGGPPDGPPGSAPQGPPAPNRLDGYRPHGGPQNKDREKEKEEELTTEDPYTEKPLNTIKVTDLPQEAVDDALNLDYGRYTTLSFYYENRQWMYSKPEETCFDNYIKCYTSMIAPMPVCVMYSTRQLKVETTYCDAYYTNCRKTYRYWRIVGYGKCTVAGFGWPFLDDYR